jgi:hypothetical protein
VSGATYSSAGVDLALYEKAIKAACAYEKNAVPSCDE